MRVWEQINKTGPSKRTRRNSINKLEESLQEQNNQSKTKDFLVKYGHVENITEMLNEKILEKFVKRDEASTLFGLAKNNSQKDSNL